MNIVMFTNTFTPVAGGVARSVETFTAEYRHRGHRVLVVAPEFPNMPKDEQDVVRIPAIQRFNGSDFSMVLPVSGLLNRYLNIFKPDVVHAHHPYLLGATALRIARYREIPLVFTHHTRYEEYTHYVPGNSPKMRNYIIEMSTRYANLTNQVIAPSDSIRDLLIERKVVTPIEVIPTGVDVARFASGDGKKIRAKLGIPKDAPIIGHLGRLAPEKNLDFLSEAVTDYLRKYPNAHFLVVGSGKSEDKIRQHFAQFKEEKRFHHLGVLEQQQVVDAYHAMSVFVFASKSETQGMVLTEAMAAGVPVVALDAPGVREVVKDRVNGRLLYNESIDNFINAIEWVLDRCTVDRNTASQSSLGCAALDTAKQFSMECSAKKALACYQSVQQVQQHNSEEEDQWHGLLQLIKAEWGLIKSMGSATQAAFSRERE